MRKVFKEIKTVNGLVRLTVAFLREDGSLSEPTHFWFADNELTRSKGLEWLLSQAGTC